MTKIKRYRLAVGLQKVPELKAEAFFTEAEDGQWVLYRDVEGLVARLAELEVKRLGT